MNQSKSEQSSVPLPLEEEERDDAVIGVAVKWSLAALVLLVACGGTVAYFLTRPEPPPPVQQTPLATVEVREAATEELPKVPFTDVTEAAGITFVHRNGAIGEKLLPETMGGGCAFFDFDNDGDQDLLLVGSQDWPGMAPQDNGSSSSLVLYANDGSGRFTDVTADSGLEHSFYGMGAAVGDYDNDGRVDLFCSAVGRDRLFHNEGGGKFRDVTTEAGVAGDDSAWGTSCGWFDYDRDGDLDLFVCNYLLWTREYDVSQKFQLTGGGRAYGRPQNFEGAFPYLYRNNGNGHFEDVTEAAGLQVRNPATDVPMAKSLGVTFADFDGDGWSDVIVANDTVQNFLFHNRQDGTFEEVGALAGVAFDMDGNARGAMGIDASHFRNDDSLGVAIGNFSNEMTALYVTEGRRMLFMDEAISTGLGPNTRLQLTFGLFYLDCDLDGRLDLFASNGHLEDEINRVQPSQHYEQPPQLFWNCGPKAATEFRPMTEKECGPDFFRPIVGRGASYADIDGDGDLDLLITTTGRRPRLLRNDQQLGRHWLRVQLRGKAAGRQGIGSWVTVQLADRTLRQQVMPTRSYLSQVETPLTFGLGDKDRIESIHVMWSDGSSQEIAAPPVDQLLVVEQE
ncbi:MAG: CRTAC1 family protein [Planctomycetaceae bacterium]|nr:CRTAC1 family protein [Planctomycetaceae bacterium]